MAYQHAARRQTVSQRSEASIVKVLDWASNPDDGCEFLNLGFVARTSILATSSLNKDSSGIFPSTADERTRTSTPLRALAPEASASANSATSAVDHPFPTEQGDGFSRKQTQPSTHIRSAGDVERLPGAANTAQKNGQPGAAPHSPWLASQASVGERTITCTASHPG